MMNFTPELVEKAKAAQTAEELLSLAKATGVEMTAAEAAAYFAQLNPKTGELSDDDLDAVSGGACSSNSDLPAVGTKVRITSGQTCKKCGSNIGRMDARNAYGPMPAFFCVNCSWLDGFIADEMDCTYEIID